MEAFSKYEWGGRQSGCGFQHPGIQGALRRMFLKWNEAEEASGAGCILWIWEQMSGRHPDWRNMIVDILTSFLYSLSFLPMRLIDKNQNKVEGQRSFLGHRVGGVKNEEWRETGGAVTRSSNSTVQKHTCHIVNSITLESCSEGDMVVLKKRKENSQPKRRVRLSG